MSVIDLNKAAIGVISQITSSAETLLLSFIVNANVNVKVISIAPLQVIDRRRITNSRPIVTVIIIKQYWTTKNYWLIRLLIKSNK